MEGSGAFVPCPPDICGLGMGGIGFLAGGAGRSEASGVSLCPLIGIGKAGGADASGGIFAGAVLAASSCGGLFRRANADQIALQRGQGHVDPLGFEPVSKLGEGPILFDQGGHQLGSHLENGGADAFGGFFSRGRLEICPHLGNLRFGNCHSR